MPSSPKNHPPSPHPGAHLPERPPPPPLQSPAGRAGSRQVSAGMLGRWRSYVEALPVSSCWWCLLLREGQEEKLEASGHLHHFLLLPVSPFQLLTFSSLSPPFVILPWVLQICDFVFNSSKKGEGLAYSEDHLRFCRFSIKPDFLLSWSWCSFLPSILSNLN